jgi:hypothetical protein
MKQNEPNLNIEGGDHLAGQTSPFLQLIKARTQRRIRLASPLLPAPDFHFVDRKILAALRAAELSLWQASGGDFLRSANSN